MAPSIINNDAVQGETFLPGQVFVFGGFALRANSLGHLEQIESYAPGHQVRFGSLNYMADIREDLIFDGFEPRPSAPHCLDGHDIALPPNNALEAAHASVPTIDSEPTTPIEDQRLDAASGAAISEAIEPNASPALCTTRDSEDLDSSPDSEPPPAPANRIRLGANHGVHRRGHLSALTLRRHPEFYKVSLSLSGEPWPDYGQQGWDWDDE